MLDRIFRRCQEDADTGCLHWLGAVQWQGYPIVYAGGRHVRARRLVYETEHGERVGPRRFVTMRCGERACLNPAHMRIESRSQYMRRAVNRKPADVIMRMQRARRASASTKLTLDQAREIRGLRNGTALTLQAIAARYAVSRALVHQIVTNRVWREPSPWAI